MWEHRTARVNGINIHYVIQGQGSPVILVHGWPEFWYSWRKVIPALAERFQVIAPDMRGFGYSDKPLSGYDTRTAASDIYELAQYLGHERVALVGHDIGARVTYRFTLDHEDAVQRLALLDAGPPMEQLGPQPPQVIRERWHSYFHQQPDLPERLVEGNVEAYLRHFLRDWSINKYTFTDEEVSEYVRAYSQPGALRGGFSYYRAAAYEDPPHWLADAERKLSTSVLYLWGARRARTAAALGSDPLEAWQQVFPKARGKHLGEYGHFLQSEAPELVNRELLAFLSEGAG
ncbi:MAG: alpha/beta hydrolase [Dehalococcoidia bacterium]|nr:alpha/beta hydrolase [Dehalococcoidia bacterium]